MFFNVTLNNDLATVTRGDIQEKPLDHLQRLKKASILNLGGSSKEEVVKELKERAIAEIGLSRRILERVIAIFLYGYKTSVQKVAVLSLEIIHKSYDAPKVEEKKDYTYEEIESLLQTDECFKAISNALKKNRFEQARLLTFSPNIKNQEQIRNFIFLKEIDFHFEQRSIVFIPELLTHLSDRELKKEILNKIEKIKAEKQFPQISSFLKAEKTEPSPNAGANFFLLMDDDKLDEALIDLKGRDCNRVVTKIAEYYLEKGKLTHARFVAPFLSDAKLRNDMQLKIAYAYQKANLLEECFEVLNLLPCEIEGEARKEAAKTLYSKTKNSANVYAILHNAPGRDAALLALVSVCISLDNFNEAEGFALSIDSLNIREQALNLISRKKSNLEKQVELISFAEAFVKINLTVPLESIDSKKALKSVVADLDAKINGLQTLEQKRACYDYLASVDHFELAHAYALKSTHRIALITRYGLYREEEIVPKIKKWLPAIPVMNEEEDYYRVLNALQEGRCNIDFYNSFATYFKGKLIESLIEKGRHGKAHDLAESIRFVDFKAAIKALCK